VQRTKSKESLSGHELGSGIPRRLNTIRMEFKHRNERMERKGGVSIAMKKKYCEKTGKNG